MKPYKIIFFGSPAFALPSLECLHRLDLIDLIAVFTQPDRPSGRKMKFQPTPVKTRGEELGYSVFSPESVNTPEVMDILTGLKADLGVVVAFGQILSSQVIHSFSKGMVNVHGSLLPRWRGAAPIQRALMEGDTVTGVSLQKVVRKLDAGDLLGERTLAIDSEMNAVTLYRELSLLGSELLSQEMVSYLSGALEGRPQDESRVTLAPKIDKGEAQINWSETATKIHDKVRGLAMGPHASTYCGAKKLKIHRAKVMERPQLAPPGEVLEVGPESFVVQCGQRALEVLEVQPESKSKMAVRNFLSGYGLKPGDRLCPPTNAS